MRNNTKKGFTLVELLVVIAILAILATVSVVGYTSYIQGAAVRVDKDLATQLNHFLAAYQVNNPVEITEDNCWEVTQELLEQAGIEELNPQSAQYHHHFYYNLEKDEYVLLPDSEAIDSAAGFEHIIGLFMRAFGADLDETPKFAVRPGNCFTVENKYFIVDSTGDLVDVLRGFYDFTSFEGDSTYHKFQSFVEKIHGSNVQPLKDMLNKCVFVTNEGNFVDDVNAAHDTLIFHEGATAISSIKTDETGKPATIGEDGVYLLVLSEDTRIELPAGISLPTNSLNIGFAEGKTPNVTVVIDAKQWSEVKEYVDADFTKSNVAVELGGVKYEIYVNDVCEYTTDETKGAVRDHLKYNNPMTDFNIKLSNDEADNLIANAGENAGTIAWEKKTFKLELTNITGKKNDGSAISNTQVKWTSLTEGVTVDQSGNVTVGASVPSNIDTIQIKAEALISAEGYTAEGTPEGVTKTFANKTFTISVAAVESNIVLVGGTSCPLVNNTCTVTHTIGENENVITLAHSTKYINYSTESPLVEIDDDYTVTSSDTSVATYANGKININQVGTTTISVVFDVYTQFNYTIQLEVTDAEYDTTTLPFQINTANSYKYLGGQSISLDDIFVLNNGTFPANTKVVVFSGAGNIGADMKGRYLLSKDTTQPLYVTDTDYVLDENNKSASGKTITTLNSTITLLGACEGDKEIAIALYADGVRVSPDYLIHIVDAVNVDSYTDLKTNIATGNVVLLNNITDMTAGEYFTIPAGNTLYGNLFDIDIKNGVTTGVSGIITVKGTLQDARVLGAVYPEFGFVVSSPYGTSAVSSNGGTIDNCYISNTRAPLRVEGTTSTTTLKNTVLFGGRYANIDLRQGTLKIDGTVTTVQQPVKTQSTKDVNGDGKVDSNDVVDVIGVGISAWFDDASKLIQYADDNAKLIQYNFLNEDLQDKLPLVTLESIPQDLQDKYFKGQAPKEELIAVGSLFSSIFTEPKYDRFVFNKDDATKDDYVHAGIISLDKYLVTVDIDCTYETSTFLGITTTTAKFPTSASVTVTLIPTITEDQVTVSLDYTGIIGYDARGEGKTYWKEVSCTGKDTNDFDGVLTLTTNLQAGVPVELKLMRVRTGTKTGYLGELAFSIDNAADGKGEGISSLLINRTDTNYGRVTLDVDLRKNPVDGSTNIIETAMNNHHLFHEAGLHFLDLSVDIRGYHANNNTYAEGLLAEYEAMGNYYAENGAGATFDENGNLVTYTEYIASQSSN